MLVLTTEYVVRSYIVEVATILSFCLGIKNVRAHATYPGLFVIIPYLYTLILSALFRINIHELEVCLQTEYKEACY